MRNDTTMMAKNHQKLDRMEIRVIIVLY
jgi:hypothetical protein